MGRLACRIAFVTGSGGRSAMVDDEGGARSGDRGRLPDHGIVGMAGRA
jgi:hypothetical protein